MKWQILLLVLFFGQIHVTAQDECLSGNCENGYGKLKCECGYIFEGQFKGGKKVSGKMIKENLVYEGDFKNDMAHGMGKITFADSSWYRGDFAFSQPDGVGEYHLASGDVYKGEMKAGNFHGEGMRMNADQTEYFLGMFVEDDFVSGVHSIQNQLYEAGSFRNKELHGYGIRQNLADSTTQIGIFKRGNFKDGEEFEFLFFRKSIK
jgi:hypothetical protein